MKPVYDYLVRYPLTANHLAAVTSIEFDGGNEIYTYPFPFWSGEDGEFDVQSLEGIDRLINLKSIEIIALLNSYDLKPLAGLKKLEHLGLDHGRYEHGEELLQLPALKSLTCGSDSFEDATILQTLRARGIAVRTMG